MERHAFDSMARQFKLMLRVALIRFRDRVKGSSSAGTKIRAGQIAALISNFEWYLRNAIEEFATE